MPIIAALAFIIGGYFAFTTANYVLHNYQAGQDERAIRADIARLDREHDELIAVRDYLESDEYIEYQARRTLGLVRPGQTLVIVSGATPAAAPIAPGSTAGSDSNAASDGAASTGPDATPTPGGAWWHRLFRDEDTLP